MSEQQNCVCVCVYVCVCVCMCVCVCVGVLAYRLDLDINLDMKRNFRCCICGLLKASYINKFFLKMSNVFLADELFLHIC